MAVTVLAGERTAEGADDFSGALDEIAEVSYSFWSSEVEIDTAMHAALAVVAVERAAIAVFAHQGIDGAEIVAKLRGRNGGIVPTFPAVGLAGNKDRAAERGFADMPDRGGLSRRANAGDGRGGPGLRGASDGFGLRTSFFGGPGAHFNEKEAGAGREVIETFKRQAFAAHEIDKRGIEALKADGFVFEGERDDVGGEKGIVETEHGEDAEGRAGGEIERGRDDIDAGALRTHQSAGNIEVVFGQQLVEVVAGDTTRDAGKFFADQFGVAVANAREAGIDLSYAAARADERVEFDRRSGADGHARTVVEHDFEGFHVVDNFAAQQAVHAATVVAYHASEGTAGVGGGVRRVGQVMHFGGVAQPVENNAGLDAGDPRYRIN